MTNEEKQERNAQAKDFFLQELNQFLTTEEKVARVSNKIEMYEDDLNVLLEIEGELLNGK